MVKFRILEKEPADLDNRLDMIGEGDGKVKDDPQLLICMICKKLCS